MKRYNQIQERKPGITLTDVGMAQTVGEDSRYAARAHNALGKIALCLDKHDAASHHLLTALRIMEQRLGTGSPSHLFRVVLCL
jgi:hypothetical protein